MRLASWFGGLLIAVAVATSVGAISLARQHSDSAQTLTASRQPAAGAAITTSDRAQDPARKLQPPPTPSPSPSPTAAPTAPPAAPAAPPQVTTRAPSRPALVINSTQQSLINQDRAARGLGPLTWSSCLYNVAVSNAKRIAAQGYLSHTNGPQVDLGCGLGHQAGENVGDWSLGINDRQLNTMFINSADHRANILGPYNYVATAWVVASNGYGFIAVEFS